MLSHQPTGYPFLRLAQAHGVDYGDVLVTTEWLRFGPRKRGPITDQPQHVIDCARNVPVRAFDAICALLDQPVGDRGGPHWCSCGKAHFSTEPCKLAVMEGKFGTGVVL